jgi:hypothetical protein
MKLSPSDRQQIEDLYKRYCYAIDSLDVAAWVDCFTPDGLFAPSFGAVRGEFRGQAELADFASNTNRNQLSRHWNANLLIDDTTDPISASCYALLIDYAETTPRLLAHVVYYDKLVRYDGRWRFIERRPRHDSARSE